MFMNFLLNLFKINNKNYKIQSFTFYVPSPPARSTGYREKQFDKIFYNFINKGYRILHFKTQQSSSSTHSGMWLIFIVQATNYQSEDLKLEDVMQETEIKKSNMQDQIDGLYYIEDDEKF